MLATVARLHKWEAHEVLATLAGCGIDATQIGVVGHTTFLALPVLSDRAFEAAHTNMRAGAGAAVGSVVGVMTGISAIVASGLGPLIVVGALASALVLATACAGVGAATGRLLSIRGSAERGVARQHDEQVLMVVRHRNAFLLNVEQVLLDHGALWVNTWWE